MLSDWRDLPGRRDTSQVPGRRIQTITLDPGDDVDEALGRLRETIEAASDVRATPRVYLTVSTRPPGGMDDADA